MEKRSRIGRDVAALFALAFAFRLFYLFAFPHMLDTADGIHYIDAATCFTEGRFHDANPKIPILYPLLMAAAHGFVADFETTGYGVSFIASVLLVLPVYCLARAMHGGAAARIAGLAVALWPWLADYACRVGPDALGCTLWFTGALCLAQGMRRGGLWLPGAVAACFALHLTRAEGTVILGAAAAGAVLFFGEDRRRFMRRWAVFAVSSAVLLVLYAFYTCFATGNATVNYRAHLIADEFVFSLMAKTGVKTISEVLPIMLGPALLLFLGVGLFHRNDPDAPPRDVRLELFILYLCAVQWCASLFVLSPEPRYLMSVIVAFALWSARGIDFVARDASQLPFGRVLRRLPVAAMAGFMLLGTATGLVAQRLERRPAEPIEYRIVGTWMKENLEPGLVFTRKPQVAYYADMPSTGPALDDSLDAALDRAQAAGARYVVVDQRYTAQMVPALAALLDPANAPPRLCLLHNATPYPDCRVVVYELGNSP